LLEPLLARRFAREELEAIRGEIAELQARLLRVRERSSGIRGELERTQVELELQEKRLAEATAAARWRSRPRSDRDPGRRLERKLVHDPRAIALELVGLYRLGRHGYLRLFRRSSRTTVCLPESVCLRLIAHRDAETLDRFRATRTRI
jgi:septal ring factor EnvC (AmiA/AmiB activator)